MPATPQNIAMAKVAVTRQGEALNEALAEFVALPDDAAEQALIGQMKIYRSKWMYSKSLTG